MRHFRTLIAYALVGLSPDSANRISGIAAHHQPGRRKLMRRDFPVAPSCGELDISIRVPREDASVRMLDGHSMNATLV